MNIRNYTKFRKKRKNSFIFLTWEPPTSLKMMVQGIAPSSQSFSTETFMATPNVMIFIDFIEYDIIILKHYLYFGAIPQEEILKPLSKNEVQGYIYSKHRGVWGVFQRAFESFQGKVSKY